MPLQDILLGNADNDGAGDDAKTAGQKINANNKYLLALIQAGLTATKSYKIFFTGDGIKKDFYIPGLPDNVDVVLNSSWKIEGVDDHYVYDDVLGKLTMATAPHSGMKLEVRYWFNVFSIKSRLIITEINQATFHLANKPKNVDIIFEGSILIEGADDHYVYDPVTGDLVIVAQTYIDLVKLTTIIETRQIL